MTSLRQRSLSAAYDETQAEKSVNGTHGEKGGFVKVTVTLPPEIYELILGEVTRRKMTKSRNPQISAVIREAVVLMSKKGAML
jgi:transcriptional regulator of met regulon